MALFDCKFFSETLGMSSSMQVILPEPGSSQLRLPQSQQGSGRSGHPTLLLLHGMGDDDTAWIRSTSLERYVAPLGLAVVMPNVHRSFYTNMASGYRYWDYVTTELLAKARAFFPLSSEREANFVAGLSMGGYGAFKIALSRPEDFAAAASLSGALDIRTPRAGREGDFELIFGDVELAGSEHDLFRLAADLSRSQSRKPKLFQCCGTEDFLYPANVKFREHVATLDLDYTYEEGPGGHEWAYWDAAIARVLAWLPRL
jgi:S-formylglutathione hydrolase FrmB